MEDLDLFGIPLLSEKIKEDLADNTIELCCGYAGCGSADSWPEVVPLPN